MKAYKLIPILAVTLLVPSFAEAKHSTRNKQRHRTERIYRQGPPPWAPAYGHRAKHTGHRHGRGFYRDQHNRPNDRHYRDRSHRRDRRGINIGGVIVISF